MLWALMLIPMAFFMISNPIMAQFEMQGLAQAVSMGYIFLPFIMMAGLGIFPITALEGAGYALPVMIVTAALPLVVDNLILVPFNSYFGALWLLGLIGVVATFAGMSQLHFMGQLVKQSSHDPLTQVYNRRAGIDLLAVHFEQAKQGKTSLALAFVDLDHFKQINDHYGHEEGDNALREAAERIRRTLRGTDLVVRWGGEEFVVIMPNTSHDNAMIPMRRLLERGLGMRPDEKELTASIGVAERVADACSDYRQLIDIADQRMYMAKDQGRCRIVAEGNQEVTIDPQTLHQPAPLVEGV
jgi:diguanylate cyclase (GGDEF)-like protein